MDFDIYAYYEKPTKCSECSLFDHKFVICYDCYFEVCQKCIDTHFVYCGSKWCTTEKKCKNQLKLLKYSTGRGNRTKCEGYFCEGCHP